MDCDNVIKADTVEEVVAQANAHAQAVHMDVLKAMRPQQMAGMDQMLRDAIKA
jgi:predicted small metal-binding protein